MWWKTAVMTAVLAALAALVTGGGARELDPAACAARFDVQRDKIIRTEESREMGARYLSELDVGARHECLRLCCETEACDVFVYEEKGPGSCYLFECGPPEDFRCKFTAHSNFSSGVLALSRRLAELQDQELRAHHERELNRLRSVPSTTVSTTTAMSGPRAALPQPPPPPPLIHPHPPGPQEPPRRCSRYQFECRRGGECIAVYNACDGVPQCADGSDEAPELGCPAPPAVPTAAAAPPPTSPTTTLLVPLQEDGGTGGIGGGGEGVGSNVDAGRWPHRLAQAQVQAQHRYTVPENAVSSHIFSHKGGLIQEPEGGAQFPPYEPNAPAPALSAAAPAPPLWSRRPWPLQPLQLQSGMESVPEERGWVGPAGAGYWTDPDPRRAWPVPQQRPDADMSVYLPPKTMPEIAVQYGIQRQALRDGPKKGFDLNTKLDPTETAPPPPPPPPSAPHPGTNEKKQSLVMESTKKKLDTIKSTETSSKPGGTEQGANGSVEAHRHYSVEEHEEHEGLSERPPAAVLLLVLGVLMTSVLGAMLGCRARAARRRLRRGKSSFAHDADYLVNGMYL